jgi:hypothetical protein
MNHYNRLRVRRDSARLCKYYIPEKFLSLSNKYKIVVSLLTYLLSAWHLIALISD